MVEVQSILFVYLLLYLFLVFFFSSNLILNYGIKFLDYDYILGFFKLVLQMWKKNGFVGMIWNQVMNHLSLYFV